MGLICPNCGERNAEFNPRCRGCDTALPEISRLTQESAATDLATPQAEMEGRRISHYEVREKLGSGGMGQVYRATDLKLRRSVALKFLSPRLVQSAQARSRFIREAQTASTLDHPNIGTIYEIGEDEAAPHGQMFIAMALYEGQTLERRIQEGLLEVEEVLHILIQVAAGLKAAHAAGVVHRDLKPANIMLVRGSSGGRSSDPFEGPERVKILDFGLAKLISDAEDSGIELTESGKPLGTVAYMSPEQARGDTIDHRTDLWSLGVVAYEMLSGLRPFQADSKVSILGRILTEEPKSLEDLRPGLPPQLLQLVRNLLCKPVESRVSSAASVLQALNVDSDEQGSPPSGLRRNTPGKPWNPRVQPSPRRPIAVWGGLGLASLLGLAAALNLGQQFQPQPQSPHQWLEPSARPMTVRRSIAVLSFRNLTEAPDKAWLSTALSEMLRTELSVGDKLRMVPGEIVARILLDLPLDTDSFGRETLGRFRANLGTDLIVSGSYLSLGQGSNGRIRLDLRLQDTASGETLASVSQTGNESELFELVSQTGALLRQKLEVGPRSAQEAEWVRTSLPSNPEAARSYAEGLAKMRLYEAIAAQGLLERAVALEPNFPLAHTALASALRYLGGTDRGRDVAKRAWELSATLPKQEQLITEGIFRLLNQEWDLALQIYRNLFEYYPDNPEYGLMLAEVQKAMGRGQEARDTLLALRRLPPPAGEDLRIDALEARTALVLGKNQVALEAAKHLRDLAQQRGLRVFVADASFIETLAYEQLGDYEKAFEAALEAKKLFAALGDLDGVAQQLFSMSKISLAQGYVEVALENAKQALEIRWQIGDRSQIARTKIWVGALMREQGDLAEATKQNQEALESLESTNDTRGQIMALIEAAWLSREKGDTAEAHQYLERALVLQARTGVYRRELWPRLVPIFLALDESRFTEAEELATDLLAELRERPIPSLKSLTNGLLADALVGQGRLEEAREAFANATERSGPREDLLFRLQVTIIGAKIDAASKEASQVSSALSALEGVIAAAERAGLVRVQFYARLAAGEIELSSGREREGRQRLDALEAGARAKGYNGIARKAKGDPVKTG